MRRRQMRRLGANGGMRTRCGQLPEEILVQRLKAEHAGDQDATEVPGGITAVTTALPILRDPWGRHLVSLLRAQTPL